jgi:hypothetical protein
MSCNEVKGLEASLLGSFFFSASFALSVPYNIISPESFMLAAGKTPGTCRQP